MNEGRNTPDGLRAPAAVEAPPMPGADVDRDADGILLAGEQLVIGITPRSGTFFIGPRGHTRSGGVGRGRTFPGTPEGWARAWQIFSAGDFAAASIYIRRVVLAARARQAAGGMHTPLERLDMQALADSSFAAVPGCTRLTGYGDERHLFSQHDVTLYFLLDRLEVGQANTSERVLTAPLGGIVSVRVDGPGMRTSGGGFIGGGFGFVEAIEGMLMAHALNAITTRTSVQTFIEVHEIGRHNVWVTEKATPEQLKLLLKPFQARLSELRLGRGATSSGVVDQLERLAALRDAGVVTEEEFQSVKATILSRFRDAG